MPTRYIDIVSSSRNRSNHEILNDRSVTGPSNFIVSTDVNVSNNQTLNRSLDPISNQVEIIKWRRSDFMLNSSGASTRGIRVLPFTKLLPDSVNYSVSTPTELILTSVIDISNSVGVGGLQELKNYYWGAVLNVDSPAGSATILEYEYLGSNKCLIKIDQPLVMTSTSKLQIVDPTTNHEDTSAIRDYPYLFVPGGPTMESLVGSVLFAEVTGSTQSTFTISAHDASRNMIKVVPLSDPLVSGNSILEISQLVIRTSRPAGGYNNRMDFLNTSPMNGYRANYDIFPLSATTNMVNISDFNFVEISSDTEYGVAVVSGSLNTQFSIIGGSRTESAEDSAYIGCKIRLILNNTDSPNLYTTEDRFVSSYVGATNIITVSDAFSNVISTYDVIKYMIFFPTEAIRVKSFVDLNTKVFNSYGTLSGNKLNLLEYTSAPGISYVDKNYEVSATQLRLGDFYKGTRLRSLTGEYIGVDTGSGVYAYGYIINHTINFFNDEQSVVRQNFIEVNPAFYTTCSGLAGFPNIDTHIKSVKTVYPFTRNPYSRISEIASERYAILLQTEDNHAYLVNSGGGIISGLRTPEEYKISLINLSLPNKLLKSSKGGYITEYPFVYVRFSNSDIKKAGSFLSNNKNINTLNINFKVLIDNTVDDQITKFVVLKAGDMKQIQTIILDADIHFAVYLPDGSLFQTIESDRESPWKPTDDLQISALFSMENVCVAKK